MAKAIKIFDPKERPFGALSNNYQHIMYIDNQEWYTVTNYIYANLLKTPMFAQQLRSIKAKDAKTKFQILYQQELDNVIQKSLNKSLPIKFDNPSLADLLIGTGNSPIFYVSNNPLLGTGPNNEGKNLYGYYLMQIRHLLRITLKQKKEQQTKAERDRLIYEIYLAEKGLIQSLEQGNSLGEFINMQPSEIIDNLGRERIMEKAPKFKDVMDLVNKGVLPNIVNLANNPKNLTLEIRKKLLRQLRLRKLRERKEIIFDMYADYLLEKFYPDLDPDKYQKAKQQQFHAMGWQQKNDLEERLYDLFTQGMLSNRLSDAIDERLTIFKIPSSEEVDEAENTTIVYKNPEVAGPEEAYVPISGEPILVYPIDFKEMNNKYRPYVQFSPISLTGMLNIDGRTYPTITHYLLANMFAHIPGIDGIPKAYAYLLADPTKPIEGVQSFLSPDNANQKYEMIRDHSFHDQLRKFAKKGIEIKFNDRIMQDILMMTENRDLIWNDFSDPILGIGSRDMKGENFVGKYLMKLRKDIFGQRKEEDIDKVDTNQITMILKEDFFMQEWMQMRIRDMCRVIIVMKNYVWEKNQIKNMLSAEFVSSVLDKIYQPCSHLFGATNLVIAEVPDYFRVMVSKCNKFSKVSNEIIEIIWKRIVVMLYFLIKYIKNSTIQNIRSVISKIELMVSENTHCVEILSDEYDNCIVSALINLIRGIVIFNKKFGYVTEITEQDVITAASIILNADVSSKIKPATKLPSTPNLQPENADEPIEWQEEEFVFPQEIIDEAPPEEEFIDFADYGDYGDENIYSPGRNMLLSVLGEIPEIKNPKELAKFIEGAIETIKAYPMSKQIKKNRINFFATQR